MGGDKTSWKEKKDWVSFNIGWIQENFKLRKLHKYQIPLTTGHLKLVEIFEGANLPYFSIKTFTSYVG